MSPIYVRPAREQSEHDRLIRHLQLKYKKYEVAVNIDGVDPPSPVKIGQLTLYPDVILTNGKKLVGLIEVETGESVNNLEVMAQWVHFGKARVPFHLYVPVHGYEAARRLCDAYHVKVGEVWTYRPVSEGFDLVRMHAESFGVFAAPIPGAKIEPAAVKAPAAPAKPQAPSPEPAVVSSPRPHASGPKPSSPKLQAPSLKPQAPSPKSGAKPQASSPKAQAPSLKSKAPVPSRKPAAKPVKAAAKPAKPAPKAVKKPVPAKKAAKPAKKGGKAVAGKAKKAPARKGR